MNNPFTIAFGSVPENFISRPSQTNKLIDNFIAEKPSTPIYMITGVRGSGKTVMLTEVAGKLSERSDWITVEINPEDDMMSSLISKLYNIEKIHPLFAKAKLNISIKGKGLSIENDAPTMNDEVVLEKMLQILKKQNKRLMVAIDEVVNNQHIKKFAHEFQILIRKNYDIYLLMSGLYENIYNLQNEDSLTFLYRAPRIVLEPLNMMMISRSYANIFNLDSEKANYLSKLTQGYPFAYQVLGYLRWDNPEQSEDNLIAMYDQYLSEYVYDKIWSELSDKDKTIIDKISQSNDYVKTQQIREELEMSSSLFSVYRDKLIRKGLLDISKYGYLRLVLPRFSEYVSYRKEFDI